MKLIIFADAIEKEIDVSYRPTMEDALKYTAKLHGAEVADGITLRTEFGVGSTPEEAMDDYFQKLAGRTIVFHATDKDQRQEFSVMLTVDPALVIEKRKQLILKYKQLWEQHLTDHPEDEWMQDYVLSYPNEEIPVLIPICTLESEEWLLVEDAFDDLKQFGTSCGNAGCYSVFGKPGALEFLQAFGVEFIVGSVSKEYLEEVGWAQRGEGVPLNMVAFKGSEELAAGFANFVGTLGGSLRWDDSSDGQCLFESE